jgi:hypothetical protein
MLSFWPQPVAGRLRRPSDVIFGGDRRTRTRPAEPLSIKVHVCVCVVQGKSVPIAFGYRRSDSLTLQAMCLLIVAAEKLGGREVTLGWAVRILLGGGPR